MEPDAADYGPGRHSGELGHQSGVAPGAVGIVAVGGEGHLHQDVAGGTVVIGGFDYQIGSGETSEFAAEGRALGCGPG